MNISGNNYNNDTFQSLLEGLSDNKDVELVVKKQASQETKSPISGMDIFSSTTQNQMDSVLYEELQTVASELQWAADKAKVELTENDLRVFASQVREEGLRGKKLERAAQKYCNTLSREIADPIAATKITDDGSIERLASHSVTPAGYPVEEQNDSMTGKFMGCSKNPNTIWNSNALQEFAAKTANRHEMMGDEQIRESKMQKEAAKKEAKDQYWAELQEKHSDEYQLHERILTNNTDSGRGQEANNVQKMPANSMSVFSSDRDFANIPDKTAGELLKEAKTGRANKASEARKEITEIQPAKKVDNDLSGLFVTAEKNEKNSTQRAAIDKIFEGLANIKRS